MNAPHPHVSDLLRNPNRCRQDYAPGGERNRGQQCKGAEKSVAATIIRIKRSPLEVKQLCMPKQCKSLNNSRDAITTRKSRNEERRQRAPVEQRLVKQA